MASSNFPFGTAVTTGEANFSAGAAGDTPLIVSANAAQTADVVDITNSTGATKYLAVTSVGNVTMSGTLTVTGAVTNSGNLTVSGNLAVTGTTALTGALTVTNITGPTTVTGAFTVTGAVVAGNNGTTVSHTLGFLGGAGTYGFQLTDNGAGASATPSKFLRVHHTTGDLEVVNSTYSTVMLTAKETGGLLVAASGGLPVSYVPPMYGQTGAAINAATVKIVTGQTTVAATTSQPVTISGTGNTFTSANTYTVLFSVTSSPVSTASLTANTINGTQFNLVNNTSGSLVCNWACIGY